METRVWVVGLAVLAWTTAGSAGAAEGPDLEEMVRIVRSQTLLKELPEARLREAAARGLVSLLDETLSQPPFASEAKARPASGHADDPEERPINAFFTPRQFKLWRQELDGRFGGIGARIALRRRQSELATSAGAVLTETAAVEVLEALPGSASERSGLRKGDLILAIDGVSVAGRTLAELVEGLRGPEGSALKLKILRQPAAPYEVELVRSLVKTPAVVFEKLGSRLGRVRVSSLGPLTRPGLTEALGAAAKAGVGGLVLDLRGCPGGQLDAAVTLAQAFLPKGSAVLELSKGGSGVETRTTTAAPLYEGPLVVLVGGQTASGGEIVAAALQHHGRAVVAGEPTFGKRTAETVFDLAGGYAAKLSTSFFRRPGTKPGDAPGFPVQPDVPLAPCSSAARPEQVSPADELPDPQLKAAAALLEWRDGRARQERGGGRRD